MNIYVVVTISGRSKTAVAAFSNRKSAEFFIGEKRYSGAKIDKYYPPEDAPLNPTRIYAAHGSIGYGIYELAGYYLTKFEAEKAINKGGYVECLEIDPVKYDLVALEVEELKKQEDLPYDVVVVEEETEEPARRPIAPAPAPPPAAPPKTSPFDILKQARLAVYPLNKSKKPTAKLKKKLSLRNRFEKIGISGKIIFEAALLLILFYVIKLNYFQQERQSGQNLQSVEWLPMEAGKISYYKSEYFFAYEFTIEEPDFNNWAINEGLTVNEIKNSAAKIPRYLFYNPALMPKYKQPKTPEDFKKFESIAFAVIKNGIKITGKPDDETHVITGAYDRKNNRAYFNSSPR